MCYAAQHSTTMPGMNTAQKHRVPVTWDCTTRVHAPCSHSSHSSSGGRPIAVRATATMCQTSLDRHLLSSAPSHSTVQHTQHTGNCISLLLHQRSQQQSERARQTRVENAAAAACHRPPKPQYTRHMVTPSLFTAAEASAPTSTAVPLSSSEVARMQALPAVRGRRGLFVKMEKQLWAILGAYECYAAL